MKHVIKVILLFTLLIITKETSAQIAATTYSVYSIGLSTDNNNKISGELKLFLNKEYADLVFEPTVFYNFPQKDFYQLSMGLGINLSPFDEVDVANVVTLPLQLEITPFEKIKNLSVLTEVAPEFGDNSGVRLLWGIRYTFRKS